MGGETHSAGGWSSPGIVHVFGEEASTLSSSEDPPNGEPPFGASAEMDGGEFDSKVDAYQFVVSIRYKTVRRMQSRKRFCEKVKGITPPPLASHLGVHAA